ncbi:unnamed protein product [Auanema sp. JU1783]|nr:unnamed protein product [Auanema sp. JU1783]
MARLLIEMKEQRRRQAIIAAAISRAANEPATRLNMLIQEQQAAIEEVIQTQESELPSYEEAIHMNNYPNAPRIPPTIHPRDNYI